MKIKVINGSPGGKKSTTYMMVEAFLKGTRECGWSDSHILLSKMNIHHCMGCFHCWKNKGNCIFDDDMKKIMPLDCDVLLLATPLFFDNVSGLMKNFLDRAVAYANPLIQFKAGQESLHPKDHPQPKLLVMSNCGYPEQSHFEVLKVLFRRMARNMETTLIGEIYRGQGPLLKIKHPDLIKPIDAYLSLLQRAGIEIAQNLSLSADMQKGLEEPLIPYEMYVQEHNRSFSQIS